VKKQYDHRLKRMTYEIIAGEYTATSEPDVVLITLLGSCIAVCLIDEESHVVGMNHFMLPGSLDLGSPLSTGDTKYGSASIDMLVREMVSAGAKLINLRAKVFGAGNVVGTFSGGVAGSNAEFAKDYLAALDIPVIAEDLGGNWGRKLYFFSHSGEVFIKRITEG